MNKIQTILLSAGVILTTASATVLSHTLLVAPYETTNGPLPVEAQRDTGEVELVRTPVVSDIVEVESRYGGTTKVNCSNNTAFDIGSNQWMTRSEGVNLYGEFAGNVFDELYNKGCN